MNKHRSAFTLVELLVVIGIIAVLISILLPSLSRARAAANSLVCTANLRTMGQALVMYSNQNRGMLPYGYYSGDNGVGAGDFGILVTGAMSKDETTYASTLRNRIFRDSDTVPGGELHYSAHPRLMPDIGGLNTPRMDPLAPTQPIRPYKLGRIRRAAEVVMVMDGAQIISNDNNANAVCVMMDSNRFAWESFLIYDGYAKNGSPVSSGPNVDVADWSQSGQSNIRWRHMGNTVANFLFADGHAEGRHRTTGTVPTCDLLRGNINVNR